MKQTTQPPFVDHTQETNDLAHVRGQYHVGRALEVAAAGGHNIVLTGSPGVGKAMLARVLPTLLPARDTAYVFSQPQPDDEEFILSGTDVLFLRDIHRWKISTLTHLWQARSQAVTLQLIATYQPCPCGFFGDRWIECQCSARLIARHQRRLAPFLTNGFDIHSEVPSPNPEHLLDARGGECSEVVRGRVEDAREWQRRRFVGEEIIVNAAALTQLDSAQEAARLDPVGTKLLDAALRQLLLTPQALIRVLRLARTIADLAGTETVLANHLAEAIQYRPRIQR